MCNYYYIGKFIYDQFFKSKPKFYDEKNTLKALFTVEVFKDFFGLF